MRTMVTLFLLCALASRAIVAQGPAKYTPDGCGTLYKCAAPAHCQSTGLTAAEDIAVSVHTGVGKIFEDCDGFIKVHSYSERWARVEIESRVDTVKAISFTQSDTNSGPVSIFSCKIDDQTDTMIGVYEVVATTKTKTYKMTEKPPKLSCKFDVKIADGKIFDSNHKSQFEIDTIGTGPGQASIFEEHCDPSYFNFIGEDDKTMHFQKMIFEPGQYGCDSSKVPHFIQFRGENDDKPKRVDKVTCTGNQFHVHKSATEELTITHKDYMDIRCAAEAKYFCDYTVKVKPGETALDPQPSDHLQNIGRGLKCPPTHPYLFIRGNPVFVEGTRTAPEIECLNYGGSQLWTVLKETLTKEGPEVHCSNKLPCAHFYKIQEGSVKKGTLGSDGFPTCYATGVLYDAQGGEPTNFRCDEQTGEYKYNVGAEEKKVEGMKFECKYAPIENAAQNKKNTEIMAYGSIGAGIGAVVLLVGAFVAIYYYTRHAIKRERQKREAADAAAFIKYAMGADERKKALEERRKKRVAEAKKSAPSSSSGNKSPQKRVWNKFIMSIMQKATRKTVKPDAKWVGRHAQEEPFDTANCAEFKRKNGKRLPIKKEQLKKSRGGGKYVHAFKPKFTAHKKAGFPYPQ